MLQVGPDLINPLLISRIYRKSGTLFAVIGGEKLELSEAAALQAVQTLLNAALTPNRDTLKAQAAALLAAI